MKPGAIGHLRNNANVHVVDKMPGGGKKKARRKSSQSESDQGVSDMFLELMEKSCETGKMGWDEDLIAQVLKFDDDTMQDTMRKLRTGIQVSTGTVPNQHSKGVIQECRQAMKAQQEEAAHETERRRRPEEMTRGKEQQKQVKAEKGMKQTTRSEMKVGFGEYMGRTCKSIYREDRNFSEWVNRLYSPNPAMIEFQEFIRTTEKEWEDEFRETKRRELEERENKLEDNRRNAESEMEERQQILQQTRDVLAEVEAELRSG